MAAATFWHNRQDEFLFGLFFCMCFFESSVLYVDSGFIEHKEQRLATKGDQGDRNYGGAASQLPGTYLHLFGLVGVPLNHGGGTTKATW